MIAAEWWIFESEGWFCESEKNSGYKTGSEVLRMPAVSQLLTLNTLEERWSTVTWYAAHILMQVEFKSGPQTQIPIWENIYLIDAADEDEISQKCRKIGKESEGDNNGSFHWDNRPAKWIFKGVRKVIAISNTSDPENIPQSGCELTYSTFVFADNISFEKFSRGEEALATIVD